MSTAPHLATIDLLCAREFPAAPCGSDLGVGGPGYHIADLTAAGGPQDDAARADACQPEGVGIPRQIAEEQCEAERDGLAGRLVARWGAPQTFGLGGTLLRALEYGEDVPEPWASLSARASDVHAWHTGDRWIALAVARLDPSQPPALLAVATDVDPP